MFLSFRGGKEITKNSPFASHMSPKTILVMKKHNNQSKRYRNSADMKSGSLAAIHPDSRRAQKRFLLSL